MCVHAFRHAPRDDALHGAVWHVLKAVTVELILDRIPTYLARAGISESAYRRDVRSGTDMPPVKIGMRSSAVVRHECDAVIAAKINGATPEQLRTLVAELLKQRQKLIPASMRDGVAA
jgi:prophage regulatory protein